MIPWLPGIESIRKRERTSIEAIKAAAADRARDMLRDHEEGGMRVVEIARRERISPTRVQQILTNARNLDE